MKTIRIWDALNRAAEREGVEPPIGRTDIDLLNTPLSRTVPLFGDEAWKRIVAGTAAALPLLQRHDPEQGADLSLLAMKLAHFGSKRGLDISPLDRALVAWMMKHEFEAPTVREQPRASGRGRRPSFEAERLADLFGQGLDYFEAAEALGLTHWAVRKAAARFGIRPYPPARRRAVKLAREAA